MVLVASATARTFAQTAPTRTGKGLDAANCASCHGQDGTGAAPSSVGFTDIELPDFTVCTFTTPEPDDEVDLAIGHLRTFCIEPRWPRGDLNLPRPLVTEKAFPENGSVMSTTVAKDGDAAIEHAFIYGRRLGRPNEACWRVALGKTFSQNRWGRA